MIGRIRALLGMIRFSHTVFALPFAFIGAFLAARGLPSLRVTAWILVAMVGARTCAMGFNRIVDRRFDALNPRTAGRPLPSGAVGLAESWAMVVGAAALFVVACWRLNPATLALAAPALAVTLAYSLAKRITWLSHAVLGVALGLAPVGGWVATAGTLAGFPWVLPAAVVFWVAGFDTIYACQDIEVDRRLGLHSLPARFGARGAMRAAVAFHAVAFAGFVALGAAARLGPVYLAGLVPVAIALIVQHRLVDPEDLDRIQHAFFTTNAAVSVVLFGSVWLALTL